MNENYEFDDHFDFGEDIPPSGIRVTGNNLDESGVINLKELETRAEEFAPKGQVSRRCDSVRTLFGKPISADPFDTSIEAA